jgi:hypothetical protein
MQANPRVAAACEQWLSDKRFAHNVLDRIQAVRERQHHALMQCS